MVRKSAKLPTKGRSRVKAAVLSPEQPAARDEGPRLIPLRPAKDAGIGRIEHYLELADKALGRAPGKAPEAASENFEPTTHIPDVQAGPKFAENSPTVAADLAFPAPPRSFQPAYPPKLQVPKPRSLASPPKPPEITRPMLPKAPGIS
jgi:hypothetical protein